MMVLQQQQQRLWDATTSNNTNTPTQQSANGESTPTKVCHQENTTTAAHTCEFFRVATPQLAEEALQACQLQKDISKHFGTIRSIEMRLLVLKICA